MKIANRIYLVGSGRLGFQLSHPMDCHVYLIDGGSECALIDAGAGPGVDAILQIAEADGIELDRIRYLLLTHAHADHAGGTARLRENLDLTVMASSEAARMISTGDERAISLDVARAAGAYPEDYRFSAAPVDRSLDDGDAVTIGDLSLEVIATPGHASEQVSYLLRHDGHTSLFGGDTIFEGGRILLQNIWNCSLQDACASVEKINERDIDALYPGHRSFFVNHARDQVELAMQQIRQLLPPEQLS